MFKSQEEIDAYVEEQNKLAATRYAIAKAFPKQGRAGSAFWVIARYLVPRTEKTIVIGGKPCKKE